MTGKMIICYSDLLVNNLHSWSNLLRVRFTLLFSINENTINTLIILIRQETLLENWYDVMKYV